MVSNFLIICGILDDFGKAPQKQGISLVNPHKTILSQNSINE
jgi:hypothetical protein